MIKKVKFTLTAGAGVEQEFERRNLGDDATAFAAQRISPRAEQRTLQSGDLFAGRTEIGIEHAGSLYRLKITRQGKLILNK